MSFAAVALGVAGEYGREHYFRDVRGKRVEAASGGDPVFSG